jgi:hypothetical protein
MKGKGRLWSYVPVEAVGRVYVLHVVICFPEHILFQVTAAEGSLLVGMEDPKGSRADHRSIHSGRMELMKIRVSFLHTFVRVGADICMFYRVYPLAATTSITPSWLCFQTLIRRRFGKI